MVLADSHRISRVPYYLGYFSSGCSVSTTGFAPSMTDRSRSFVYTTYLLLQIGRSAEKSHNPKHATPAAITHDWFSLFRVRSPLLTESLLFSLPVGTEMFHFPTFPLPALYISGRSNQIESGWVSPFGNPRIRARLSAPRGLSQIATSFFGSYCQGIHRVLFET